MKRILVVDDNSDILELIEIILQRNGFETLTCRKGEDALRNIEFYIPHIILLDVFLGSINGIDICNKLKSDPVTEHIPIIMFSANTAHDLIFSRCKANDFIEKPFNINHLISKITFQIEAAKRKALLEARA